MRIPWYRRGKGQQLTIEASKIDLNFLNPSDWKIGDTRSIQTLVDSRDGRVYGNLTLTYEGNNRFAISLDTYDFEMHKYSGSIKSKSKTFFRNVATRIGNIQAGTGVKYKIYFTGLNTLNQEK